MKRGGRLFLLGAFVLAIALAGPEAGAQDMAAPQGPSVAGDVPAAGNAAAPAILPGSWNGSLKLKFAGGRGAPGGPKPGDLNSDISLRLLNKGRGALLDINTLAMYGYPLDAVSVSGARLAFVLDAPGLGSVAFEGLLSPGGRVSGTISGKDWQGSFSLVKADSGLPGGETRFSVDTGSGELSGSLVLPERAGEGIPLVILVSGSGKADRDGNNYSVPGRIDSMKQLSAMLAARGVASYRFDRRGAGESYSLESPGRITPLGKHAEDAACVFASLASLPWVSRLIAAGMNEGAWIAASAANIHSARGGSIDGLVVMDASGTPPAELFENSLASLDAKTREEARTIADAILEGKAHPEPSEALAAFFAASRADWLADWLRFDPATEIGRCGAPLLFVYGQSDIQVRRADFDRLLAARPQAPARMIPGMNYILKTVGNETENYDSFTNPAYRVPDILADLVASFAKAKPAPAGALPYR